MRQNTTDRSPTAFSIYLRTGRRVPPEDVEVKFNPWHDPEDGRFTFARQGNYYPNGSQSGAGKSRARGGGGSFGGGGASGSWEAPQDRNPRSRQGGGAFGGGGATGSWGSAQGDKRGSGFLGGGGSFGGGGAAGSWSAPQTTQKRPGFRGAGGSFGGGGATGSWRQVKPKRKAESVRVVPPASPSPRAAAKPPSGDKLQTDLRHEAKHGYTFGIDASDRTHRVTGTLDINPGQGRDRQVQGKAGGPDRRQTDEGGHYIARRFNGPTDAFNHFAQDKNFNHSAYAKLEKKWDRAMAAGAKVEVDIRSFYHEHSRRPERIVVDHWIDGHRGTEEFDNEPREEE